MPTIVKMSGKFVNLDAIAFVEYEEENPSLAIVHWTNGQRVFFRDDNAKLMIATLKMAASSNSPTT